MTAMLIAILGGPRANLRRGPFVSSIFIGENTSGSSTPVVRFFFFSFSLRLRFMGLAALIVTLAVMIYRKGGIFAGETLW